MMWSTRTPPECRRIPATIERNGAYARSARRSGRHGGWPQFWPDWLYGSGGAPTATPFANTVGNAHVSAPSAFTPTARSDTMPIGMPESLAVCWACLLYTSDAADEEDSV